MNTYQEISTLESKKKLEDLRTYFPGTTNELVYAFGLYLASRLNSHLTPVKFMRECAMALYDLEKGVDGYEEKLIMNTLVGLPFQTYTALCNEIPNIADAVFPPDFAREFRAIIEKIYQEAFVTYTTQK